MRPSPHDNDRGRFTSHGAELALESHMLVTDLIAHECEAIPWGPPVGSVRHEHTVGRLTLGSHVSVGHATLCAGVDCTNSCWVENLCSGLLVVCLVSFSFLFIFYFQI